MECNRVIGGKILISMFIFILLFHRASLSELSSISFSFTVQSSFSGNRPFGNNNFLL